jgi:hypothetical protein
MLIQSVMDKGLSRGGITDTKCSAVPSEIRLAESQVQECTGFITKASNWRGASKDQTVLQDQTVSQAYHMQEAELWPLGSHFHPEDGGRKFLQNVLN